MTPEGKVKKALRKTLTAHGAWYYMPVQNGMGCVGIPDIIACVPVTITEDMVGRKVGLFLGLEAKAPGFSTNTTPNQANVLNQIFKSDGTAIVADNVETLESALAMMNKGVSTLLVPKKREKQCTCVK